MPGRPPLDIGTFGKIRHWTMPDGRVQARCLYRDHDGHTRPVTRIGKDAAAADRVLKKAIADRQLVTGKGTIRSNMRLDDLADEWLRRLDESDKAINTKQQYRKILDAAVRPAVGRLRVSEADVAVCDRALSDIAATRGPSSAKTARTILTGMLGLATRHRALASNPVRDTEPISGAGKPKKGRPRALTVDQTDELCDRLRSYREDTDSEKGRVRRAETLDVPDLIDFALATGARIGELLACRAESLDLEHGTWEVNATIVRVKGEGLLLQPRTKTDAGWRVLALPPYAIELAKARLSRYRIKPPHAVLFGSPARRSLRDPSNVAGDLKECLAALGYDWPTFHTFRKTVATRMEEAGCTAREVADQLGHAKPSMTLDVYFGRSVVTAKAASILER